MNKQNKNNKKMKVSDLRWGTMDDIDWFAEYGEYADNSEEKESV